MANVTVGGGGSGGGTRVLSSDVESGLVRVWDAASGECLACLEAHEAAVQALLLVPSHNPPPAATATLSSTPAPTGSTPTPTTNTTAVAGKKEAPTLSEDAPLGYGELITASKDKSIKIWDLAVCFVYLPYFLCKY